MLAEQSSSHMVEYLTIPKAPATHRGYFRSKLFTLSFHSNPLISAAGPLFTLLERLSLSSALPPVNALRDNIEHELLAFQSKLSRLCYADEFVIIAYYLLSATIDELLGKNYLRSRGEPAEFKAFTPPSVGESAGPEQRFFDIVEHLKKQASQYLDLLEMAYYCLITGFEGEQHVQANGRQTLDNLIDELYQLIQKHRVHRTFHLFQKPQKALNVSTRRRPFLTSTLCAIGLLMSAYVGSYALLDHNAKTLLFSAEDISYTSNG